MVVECGYGKLFSKLEKLNPISYVHTTTTLINPELAASYELSLKTTLSSETAFLIQCHASRNRRADKHYASSSSYYRRSNLDQITIPGPHEVPYSELFDPPLVQLVCEQESHFHN